MKNYIIGVLIVGNLVLGTYIYKEYKINGQRRFITEFTLRKNEKNYRKQEKPQLNLFLFFSEKNCGDCLKIIDVLNTLPDNFKVVGYVPKYELKDEMKLRENTGATFELKPIGKTMINFLPVYTPTLYGVGNNGVIYFVLPGVPNEKDYLKQFLEAFYYKAYKIL